MSKKSGGNVSRFVWAVQQFHQVPGLSITILSAWAPYPHACKMAPPVPSTTCMFLPTCHFLLENSFPDFLFSTGQNRIPFLCPSWKASSKAAPATSSLCHRSQALPTRKKGFATNTLTSTCWSMYFLIFLSYKVLSSFLNHTA